ncbi:aldo/keto reductase [Roseomonas elaeocarpi]|uniref:Aldo/keto reductase n=1 Tax=Roseomonas elaeocarpi TaxID=907779 RepID=A0ABV6K194_9PROT
MPTIPRIDTQHLSIPRLGYGTWRLSGAEGQRSVESALALGYDHLDTAEMYKNEAEVGAAVAASGKRRDSLFITSKVWHENLAPDAMGRAIDASLRALKTDYLDLYLIHWPSPEMDLDSALKALNGLRESGKAKAVGVSNFPAGMLRRALDTGVPLAAVQVEYHIGLSQDRLLEVVRPAGMVLEAYSPLGRGEILEEPVLRQVAERHGASPAQVALAWLLRQDAVVAIPKAARESSQRANLDALPLAAKLTEEDVAAIARLPGNNRLVNPAFAPDWNS